MSDELRRLVLEKGEKILGKCFQCGECGSVCTIGYVKKDFSPRKIIYQLIRDDKSILDSEKLWWCTSCYSCTEVCPKDVDPEGIFVLARNHACATGHKSPPRIRSMIDSILKEGMLLPVIGRAARARDTLKLGDLKKADTSQIKKITDLERFIL
ncbi:MAG: 4Fe-4S dicluster domain-containing protein [Candidatus Altiarchaeota archaeon]|nr:4Fe-4S dicluster domain-containing protein [Candidatus Altiarchaeota archaeon]